MTLKNAMIERIEHIAQLMHKHASGTLNEKEAAKLQAWADEKEANAALLRNAGTSDYRIDRLKAYYKIPIPRPDQVPQLEQVMMPARRTARSIRRWWSYAAAVVLIACAVSFYFWENRAEKSATSFVETIQPGGNKATLTLADGRTVDLSAEQNGIAIGDEVRYWDGSGVFDSEAVHTPPGDRTAYAVLQTPRGGTYAVTLSDGTRVWLNAASTLKYPDRFVSSARVVELEGEAYFEVASRQVPDGGKATPRNLPFLVKTKGQTVEVLGTQFNISAYADEPVVQTTLVEGRVQVLNTASQSVYRLTPGMQSRVQGSQTTLYPVDASAYSAWRTGLIVLSEADLPAIIRQLERWYDVQFEGIQPPKDIHMNGEVPRDVPLATVLRALEINTGIHFQVMGRRVVMTR